MKRLIPIAVGLVTLVGAGCGSALPPAAAPSTAPSRAGVAGGKTLTFAWPVPSRAWVTFTAVDKSGTVVARFEMIVAPDAASGKISVAFAHVSLVSAPGIDVKDPASREKVRQAEALASMLPLLVSPDGRRVEVVGFDELTARLPAMYSDKPDEQASVAALVKQGRDVLVAKGAENWAMWVSTWLDSGLREGGTVRLTQRIPLLDGSTTDVPAVYTWVGPDKATPGAVDLRLDSVLEGEAFRKSMDRFLEAQIREHPSSKPGPDFHGVESLRREQHMAVVTDPATMRITSASTEETTTLALKGLGTETNREKRTYRFDWEL